MTIKQRWRRWRQFFQMAGSVRRLVSAHERCCGAGAKWAVEHYDWSTEEFGGYALEQAYREAERLDCSLSGWHRRFVVAYWAARLTHWSF